jgi:hypothetical protein
MTQLLIDGIANITFHNGILRVECTTQGPDGRQHPTGTLVIPGNIAGQIVQALSSGMQEIDKKIREQAQQAGTEQTKN